MIVLASFPRSGNTFFRNVLYEVYGVSSGHFHPKLGTKQGDHPLLKTHVLPDFLPPHYRELPSVYLIRDGRDCMVSLAHSRRNITASGSNYLLNLTGAVLARGDAATGSWSCNVAAWTARAALVIRYEDLIRDPITETEKLRGIMDLPAPDRDRLPSFESLKGGTPRYGSGGRHKTVEEKRARAQHFFRRGVAGAYKDEMPRFHQLLFRLLNRRQMKAQGYI